MGQSIDAIEAPRVILKSYEQTIRFPLDSHKWELIVDPGFGQIPRNVKLALVNENGATIEESDVPFAAPSHSVYLEFKHDGDLDPANCKFQ
jgi:hypothetical protein